MPSPSVERVVGSKQSMGVDGEASEEVLAEIVSGEVVRIVPGEAAVRAFLESGERVNKARHVARAETLRELKRFIGELAAELRPLANIAETVADRARLARLSEFYAEGVLGGWLIEHVGADAKPLQDGGQMRSDRELPTWFHDTPQGRAKRGVRCRRIAELGPAELLALFHDASKANRQLTSRMVDDRWRELYPGKAAMARRRGGKPDREPALSFLLPEGERRVWDALRHSGVSVHETERRLNRLRGEAQGDQDRLDTLLRGATIAAGSD
jgi:hypothetical protein